MPRNCSNVTHTKGSHKLRLRDRESWVHGSSTKGRVRSTGISLGVAWLRVEPGGPGFTLRCYTFGHSDENCARVHKTWKWPWQTFLQLFFMRCWRNISLSHRQLSTGNQVLWEGEKMLVRRQNVRHWVGKITSRKRCWMWDLNVGSPSQVASRSRESRPKTRSL